jgi:hypothetical protein
VRARVRLAAAALSLAALLPACGEDRVRVEPHGLVVVPLEADARGPAIETLGGVRPGTWKGSVRKRWTEVRGGGAARRGSAVLRLQVETYEAGDALETRIRVEVAEADGLAESYVRRFDGVEARVGHEGPGRASGRAVRVDGSAPRGAEDFLRGFWLAGLAGATPWFPAGSLRLGSTWPRAHLGERARLAKLPTLDGTPPRLAGGGRLEEVFVEDGETWLRIRIDGLVEAEGTRGHEAVSEGLRDYGVGVFSARDGMPRSWTLKEEVRIHHVSRGLATKRSVTLEVEGSLTPVTSDSR